MADKKISALTALTAANVAPATDVVPIVDTSATETKKITAKDLVDGALNGGTANGVLYLNGSKAATSGSALVFDGTNLGIGTASPAFRLDVSGTGRVTTEIRVKNTAGNVSYLTFEENGNGNSATFISGDARTTGNMGFWTNNTERMRLDANGNLGLGVTPSGWGSNYSALQVASRAVLAQGSSDTYLANNWYNDGTNKYLETGVASLYGQSSGAHRWYTAPSGTAGNAISFTQAMTLDASGNLGIGTSSPGEKLEVNGAIKTAAPAGGTAASWKLGAVATVSPTSPNRTIEVDIGGTIYYLHAKTTNN